MIALKYKWDWTNTRRAYVYEMNLMLLLLWRNSKYFFTWYQYSNHCYFWRKHNNCNIIRIQISLLIVTTFIILTTIWYHIHWHQYFVCTTIINNMISDIICIFYANTKFPRNVTSNFIMQLLLFLQFFVSSHMNKILLHIYNFSSFVM